MPLMKSPASGTVTHNDRVGSGHYIQLCLTNTRRFEKDNFFTGGI